MFLREKAETNYLPKVTESSIKKKIQQLRDEKRIFYKIYISAQIFLDKGFPAEIEGIKLFPFNELETNEIKVI